METKLQWWPSQKWQYWFSHHPQYFSLNKATRCGFLKIYNLQWTFPKESAGPDAMRRHFRSLLLRQPFKFFVTLSATRLFAFDYPASPCLWIGKSPPIGRPEKTQEHLLQADWDICTMCRLSEYSQAELSATLDDRTDIWEKEMFQYQQQNDHRWLFCFRMFF